MCEGDFLGCACGEKLKVWQFSRACVFVEVESLAVFPCVGACVFGVGGDRGGSVVDDGCIV